MKKIIILFSLLIIGTVNAQTLTTYNVIMINNQQIQNIVQSIQQGNASKVILTYYEGNMFIATELKSVLQQYTSVPINLNSTNNYIEGNAVTVSIYGPIDQHTSQNNQSSDFYDYDTKQGGFYNYDKNSKDDNNEFNPDINN
jgi:hypothetical protein